MGIILLPLFALSFGLTLLAIYLSIKLVRQNEVNIIDFVYGSLISVLIFVLILFGLIMEKRVYAFSPAFRVPVFMIIIPFFIHITTASSKNEKIKHFSKLTIISTLFSGVFGILFYMLMYELLEIFKIETFY